MADVDWNRYCGLVPRNIPKRTAEQLVADAERQALRVMLNLLPERRRYPGEVYPNPLAKFAEAVEGATVPEQSKETPAAWLRASELLAKQIGNHPPSMTVVRAVDEESGALPKLQRGMRVRCLDQEAPHFQTEGNVDWTDNDGFCDGDFKVTFDRGTGARMYVTGEWLLTIFPTDPSLLPPKVGQRFAMRLDDGTVHEGTLTFCALGMWRGQDGDNHFMFPERAWLVSVWPIGLRGEKP